MAGQLQVITGIATTLIALIAGLTLNFERLGRRLAADRADDGDDARPSPWSGLAVLAWLAWPWLPVAPEATGAARLAMVALLAVIVVSFSPTMTAAVITETGARGRLSELVLAMVVIADLVAARAVLVAMQAARVVLGRRTAATSNVLARFAWEIGGAVAFGALVGALFALYLRYVGREVTLVLLGVCALLSQVGATQQFEPLLAAMAAGLVIENLAVAQGDALQGRGAARRAARAGRLLRRRSARRCRLDAVAAVGLVALALVVVRIALIRLGVAAGCAAPGSIRSSARYAWTGLISQAGITLGFASVVAAEFPRLGQRRCSCCSSALIAIHELVGPVAVPARPGARGRARRRRAAAAGGRLEPRAVPAHVTRTTAGSSCSAATGGVAVALDALMRERGGVWIAHGAGTADREVVDAAGHVRVPPEQSGVHAAAAVARGADVLRPTTAASPTKGSWPLCHLVDVRPKFRARGLGGVPGRQRSVSPRRSTTSSARSTTPVFIQDYHLALVAPALRARRPDARTALFWHIPWPYPDRLRICPWRRELLAGLLANDLLAFQLERDRRNFLLAAEEELGAEVETNRRASRFDGRTTHGRVGADRRGLRPHPGDCRAIRRCRPNSSGSRAVRASRPRSSASASIGSTTPRASRSGSPRIDALLTRRPELRGRLTFVQIGVPSRSELASYAAIEAEIEQPVADVNARHAVRGGAAGRRTTTRRALTIASLVALYRLAHFCVVSSLHDGMNLVAKEFVAARDDEDGVLVLSALAGAAQELQDALIINPYDVDGFADALARAIDMPRDERRRRMRAMRRVVAGRNVFSWASDILEGLESLWTKPLHYSVRGWEDMSVSTTYARHPCTRAIVAVLAGFAASNVLLAFDYDGTLAPIAPTPARARMRATTRRLLTARRPPLSLRRDLGPRRSTTWRSGSRAFRCGTCSATTGSSRRRTAIARRRASRDWARRLTRAACRRTRAGDRGEGIFGDRCTTATSATRRGCSRRSRTRSASFPTREPSAARRRSAAAARRPRQGRGAAAGAPPVPCDTAHLRRRRRHRRGCVRVGPAGSVAVHPRGPRRGRSAARFRLNRQADIETVAADAAGLAEAGSAADALAPEVRLAVEVRRTFSARGPFGP